MQVPVSIFGTIDKFTPKFLLKCIGPWFATKSLKKKVRGAIFFILIPPVHVQ